MQGFLISKGNKEYLLICDKKNVTDAIAKKFITKLLQDKNASKELIKEYINNRYILNDIKYRISKCEYEEVKTDTIHYYKIYGKNFYITIPYNEKDTLIIFE